MADHERLEDLVPIYALGALPEVEAGEFEAHLDTCSPCRETLAAHLTTAAELDGDIPPPFEVWDRIIAAIDADKQSNTVIDMEGRRKRRSRTWGWLAGVAAAAVLVFGGVVFTQISQTSLLADSAVIAAAEEAAELDGTIVADFVTETVTVARIVLTEDGRGFVLPFDALEPLDESRTYQLWVINTDEDVISAGAIGHDPAVSTFTWTGDVAGFALTREVAGGVVSSAGDVVSVVTDL